MELALRGDVEEAIVAAGRIAPGRRQLMFGPLR
jgi:hypothetical protein